MTTITRAVPAIMSIPSNNGFSLFICCSIFCTGLWLWELSVFGLRFQLFVSFICYWEANVLLYLNKRSCNRSKENASCTKAIIIISVWLGFPVSNSKRLGHTWKAKTSGCKGENFSGDSYYSVLNTPHIQQLNKFPRDVEFAFQP